MLSQINGSFIALISAECQNKLNTEQYLVMLFHLCFGKLLQNEGKKVQVLIICQGYAIKLLCIHFFTMCLSFVLPSTLLMKNFICEVIFSCRQGTLTKANYRYLDIFWERGGGKNRYITISSFENRTLQYTFIIQEKTQDFPFF